jgi:hypothetical protein
MGLGTFAEYTVVATGQAVPVPREIPHPGRSPGWLAFLYARSEVCPRAVERLLERSRRARREAH